MSGFSIPLSGLEASSASLNVIANNLANLNTDGYKDETLNFADVYNQMQGDFGKWGSDSIWIWRSGRWPECELHQRKRQFDRHSLEYGAPRQRLFRGSGQRSNKLYTRG